MIPSPIGVGWRTRFVAREVWTAFSVIADVAHVLGDMITERALRRVAPGAAARLRQHLGDVHGVDLGQPDAGPVER